MVERFNGRISALVARTRFASAADLNQTLKLYLDTYNHRTPQRALEHQSPIQALKAWREKKQKFLPNAFTNRRNLTANDAMGNRQFNRSHSHAPRASSYFESFERQKEGSPVRTA